MLGMPKDGMKDQENEKNGLAPDLEKDEQMMDGSDSDLAVNQDVDSSKAIDNMSRPDPNHADKMEDISLIKKMLAAGGIGKRGMMSSKMK